MAKSQKFHGATSACYLCTTNVPPQEAQTDIKQLAQSRNYYPGDSNLTASSSKSRQQTEGRFFFLLETWTFVWLVVVCSCVELLLAGKSSSLLQLWHLSGYPPALHKIDAAAASIVTGRLGVPERRESTRENVGITFTFPLLPARMHCKNVKGRAHTRKCST